jgi:hypothetical protein
LHEIICPHCSKAFKIDEAGYADILKQVRDGAFEQQLHERLELAEQDKRNAVELAQAQVARVLGVRFQLNPDQTDSNQCNRLAQQIGSQRQATQFKSIDQFLR